MFGRPGLDRSTPIPLRYFTDSYSESSYLAGQVLADLPPPLSAHFTDSYSESWYLDNHVLVDPPFSLCLKWQFHRFLLWGLILGRPSLRRSTYSQMDNTPIPTDFTDSYSERSYLADQVLRDLPSQMAISQNPTLRVHIWQTRSWQIYPPQMAISQIPNLKTHISQVRTGHIYPYPPQWFHRFLLWELIFGRPGLEISTPIPHSDFTDSYSESSYLGDQVLADLPLSSCNFTDSYSDNSYLSRQGFGRSTPLKWQFHRFLIWELIFGRSGLDISTPIPHSDFTDSYSESSYLAGQVLADLPPPLSAHFTDFYSESWYLDNHFLVDPPFSLCLKWQFHRFLLWELMFGRPGLDRSTPIPLRYFTDSYSESSYLAGQVLADLPPPWVLILQISSLRVDIWTTISW